MNSKYYSIHLLQMHYFMNMYALGIILCLLITPYLYGVTSVTWVTMGICGITCGLRADQATSRVPVGLSDWPPKCGAVRLRDVWGPRWMIGELSYSN